MNRRLWLSLAMTVVGACLALAAALASPAESGVAQSVAKKGGTLRIALVNDVDYLDPALAYYNVSWEIGYATGLKLLNYPDKEAPAGSSLVPDAATSLPQVSKDGKTYVFHVRKGLRFSDGEPVTAASFAAAINRDLSPRMQSAAAQFIGDVVGAQAVLDGKATKASGVIARGTTLTIKLTKPAPDFSARVAMPFFAAIPVSTPVEPKGLDTIPSAGPYYVVSRTPNRQIVLKRNPYYTGDRKGNVEQIVYSVGASQDALYLQMRKGEVDYAADGLSPTVWSQVAHDYGINKSQFFVRPTLVLRYLALNTSQPLFKGNLALRRAVNYAIDRPALLRMLGAYAGVRATHYLPPGLEGARKQNLYPIKGADVATAQKLAKGHTRSGRAVLYTCTRDACTTGAQILQYNLEQIGIDLDVKTYAMPVQIAKMGTKGEPFDIDLAAHAAPLAAWANANARVFVSKRVGCYTYNPVYGTDLTRLCLE